MLLLKLTLLKYKFGIKIIQKLFHDFMQIIMYILINHIYIMQISGINHVHIKTHNLTFLKSKLGIKIILVLAF